MLIRFDDSTYDEFTQKQEDALDNLATAIREGKHLIITSPSLVKSIRKSNLSDKIKTLINHADSLYTQEAPLYSKFNTEVIISTKHAGSVKKGDSSCIYTSLDYFHDSNTLQATEILGENSADAKLFAKMAEIFLHEKRLHSYFKIRYECPNGGGDTTAAQLKIKSDSNRFCFCIVDSDLKPPKFNLGDTAKKLKKISSNLNTHTSFEILDIHEIENLIPIPILEQALPEKSAEIDLLLSLYTKLEDKNAYFFLDLKNGLRHSDLSTVDKSSSFKPLAVSLLKYVQKVVCEKKLSCEKGEICKECRNIILNGLGDSVLGNVVTRLNEITLQKIAETFDDAFMQKWINIGNTIASWCCGRKPLNI